MSLKASWDNFHNACLSNGNFESNLEFLQGLDDVEKIRTFFQDHYEDWNFGTKEIAAEYCERYLKIKEQLQPAREEFVQEIKVRALNPEHRAKMEQRMVEARQKLATELVSSGRTFLKRLFNDPSSP
ncbi:MAG: hypothetical protein JSS32_10255 [Verrucomicrobia bacterium]|nr:hypothetical protein [Verrucomicrobiota bacterium]